MASCYSSSSQWAASAAALSPSPDTEDGKVHITPANMVSQLHRQPEAGFNKILLRRIFPHPNYFVHHPPLPQAQAVADEGAANHYRFCTEYGRPGLEVFMYGDRYWRRGRTFSIRQTYEASRMLALRHRLKKDRLLFVQQGRRALRAGAFHADLSVSADRNLLFYHELAFQDEKSFLNKLKAWFGKAPFFQIRVRERDVSLKEVLSSYMLNSQLLASGSGRWRILAPDQCRTHPRVYDYLQNLSSPTGPVEKIHFIPLDQGMKNGGGPACMRLRVVLTKQEAHHIAPGFLLNKTLYQKLKKWIHRHYREYLDPADLLDPCLQEESYRALDELTGILKVDCLYPFQK